MAFGDMLGSASKVSIASGEPLVTIGGASSGNLLVFGVGRSATHNAGGSWGAPVGWSAIHDTGINAGNMGAAWFYKVSDGTETSASMNGSDAQGNAQAFVVQLEGPFAASPLDQSAEDVTHLASASTTQSTGTTGTTSQNDELTLAFFAADRFDLIDTLRVYTNLFTETVICDSSTARATAFMAKLVLSLVGTQECTFSCTDTGDELYGSIATFKKQVAAGGNDGLSHGMLRAMTGITF